MKRLLLAAAALCIAAPAFAQSPGAPAKLVFSFPWLATINPTGGVLVAKLPSTITITEITGLVGTATGGTATVNVFAAPSGTACGSGTQLNSTALNANGTANTTQELGVASPGTAVAGSSICITTTGTTSWTSGTGIGAVTVYANPT